MGAVMLHDAGQPEVGQLAHVAAGVPRGRHGGLQQHVRALQVSLHTGAAMMVRWE